MFYRLKPGYVLRGWKGLAWTVVKQPENRVWQLSQESFQVALLCDGETDLSEIAENPTVREILARYESEGLVEPCTEARPLESSQYYQYFDNRHIRSVIFSITGKCNYRCRHCYMDAPDALFGELSTEQALDFIDQMAACGILRVDLTGGEPFLRKDFWLLVDRILSHKMVVGTIYTNGWLLNETILDAFDRRGQKPEFSLSFDGLGWHDWMRGVDGAEKAALRALRLCQERGFPTDVEMCVHRGNQDTLPETIEALYAVGVRKAKAAVVSPTELWCKNCGGNLLSQEEYIEAMIRYIPRYYEAGCPMELMLSDVIQLHPDRSYEILAERYDGTENCLNCYLCDSARWTCYITPDGRLLPCMPIISSSVQNLFPKIQDIGLKQGLSDSYYMRFIDHRVRDLLDVNTECVACPHRFQCGGGCRAAALLEGDHQLMGCDRSMCLLWKGGYVERIRQVAEEAAAK